MHRVIVSGVAVFFAVVGITLLGGQQQAVAGHGCNGCHSAAACDGGDVGCESVTCNGDTGRSLGRARCAGRTRCEGRTRGEGRVRHARRGAGRRDCCVQPVECCGEAVVADGCGIATDAAVPTEAVPADATAPVAQ